jgi:hypothetical protein
MSEAIAKKPEREKIQLPRRKRWGRLGKGVWASIAALAVALAGCTNTTGQSGAGAHASAAAHASVAAPQSDAGAGAAAATAQPCASAVQVWLHSRKGKTFNAALDYSSAMWTAVKSGNQAEIMAEAQGFNTAARKALRDSPPSCTDPNGNYLVAIFAWINASLAALGGDLESTSSELSQANGYLSRISELKHLLPQVTAYAITPTAPVSCKNQHWPQPVPRGVIGQELGSSNVGNLWCFNVTAAYAPDNTQNVLNDPAITMDEWVITGISPAPGTVVNARDAADIEHKVRVNSQLRQPIRHSAP